MRRVGDLTRSVPLVLSLHGCGCEVIDDVRRRLEAQRESASEEVAGDIDQLCGLAGAASSFDAAMTAWSPETRRGVALRKGGLSGREPRMLYRTLQLEMQTPGQPEWVCPAIEDLIGLSRIAASEPIPEDAMHGPGCELGTPLFVECVSSELSHSHAWSELQEQVGSDVLLRTRIRDAGYRSVTVSAAGEDPVHLDFDEEGRLVRERGTRMHVATVGDTKVETPVVREIRYDSGGRLVANWRQTPEGVIFYWATFRGTPSVCFAQYEGHHNRCSIDEVGQIFSQDEGYPPSLRATAGAGFIESDSGHRIQLDEHGRPRTDLVGRRIEWSDHGRKLYWGPEDTVEMETEYDAHGLPIRDVEIREGKRNVTDYAWSTP